MGLILPKDVKDKLFNIQKSFLSSYAKIKWIPKKNLHITLKFLGDVSPSDLKLIYDRLNKLKFNTIKLNFNNLNFFKTNGKIKVLFLDIFPKKKLVMLQQNIDQELLDLFKSDQTFSPHLTLGRVKLIKKKEKFMRLINNFSTEYNSFNIDSFYLIESRLTKDGPVYKLLHKFNK